MLPYAKQHAYPYATYLMLHYATLKLPYAPFMLLYAPLSVTLS